MSAGSIWALLTALDGKPVPVPEELMASTSNPLLSDDMQLSGHFHGHVPLPRLLHVLHSRGFTAIQVEKLASAAQPEGQHGLVSQESGMAALVVHVAETEGRIVLRPVSGQAQADDPLMRQVLMEAVQAVLQGVQ